MKKSENNRVVRQVIAIGVSVGFIWLIYFGSYLPLQKSKQFIITLQGMGQMRSVKEVEDAFTIPFNIPSPIGQEEEVRHFSSVILSTVQRFGPEQASTTRELVSFVTESFKPIMDRGRGMSFDQNLFVQGSLNEVAYIQTKDPQYLASAEKYYSLGRTLSPKRPQFLYGLFDLYRIEKNIPKTTEVANEILTLWPDDTKTRDLFQQFIGKPVASSSIKTTR